MATVGTLKSILTLDVAGFGKGINRAVKDINRFQRGIGNITRALSFFGGAFGLGFTGTAIVRGLTKRIEQIDKLSQQSRETGVSLKSLGVSLNETAVRDVQRANAEINKLKTSWQSFADTVVANVSRIATAMSKLVSPTPPPARAIGTIPRGPADLVAEASKAAGRRTSAFQSQVEAARARLTPEGRRDAVVRARTRLANERQDRMERAAAERVERRGLDEVHRREVIDRRRILAGTAPSPGSLIQQPPNAAAPSQTRQRQERTLEKIEKNTFDVLQELKRADDAWQRELQRRREEENGGVSIN